MYLTIHRVQAELRHVCCSGFWRDPAGVGIAIRSTIHKVTLCITLSIQISVNSDLTMIFPTR